MQTSIGCCQGDLPDYDGRGPQAGQQQGALQEGGDPGQARAGDTGSGDWGKATGDQALEG